MTYLYGGLIYLSTIVFLITRVGIVCRVEHQLQDGALSVKQKEPVAVAIGVYSRCKYCIVFHVYKALEAGATAEEITNKHKTIYNNTDIVTSKKSPFPL